MNRRVSVALVHYPILDGAGALVTSAITNLDVHDLARSARTYGCDAYYLVHPIDAQRELVHRICDHWQTGSSGKRIPHRKEALSLVRTVVSIEEAAHAMGGRDAVEIWVTAARNVRAEPVSFPEGRARIAEPGKPVLLVFGTGWGLAAPVIDMADVALEPIRAGTDSGYNHLSVRAACAIALDRLLGQR